MPACKVQPGSGPNTLFPPTGLFLPLQNHTLMNQAVPYMYTYIIPYLYSLPEDQPSGSKHGNVEDIVKN